MTAQEIYLKVSPARLLSFLELFNKEKENQKLERFWKTSEREKNTLVFHILILNDSLDNNLVSVRDDYKRTSHRKSFFPVVV